MRVVRDRLRTLAFPRKELTFFLGFIDFEDMEMWGQLMNKGLGLGYVNKGPQRQKHILYQSHSQVHEPPIYTNTLHQLAFDPFIDITIQGFLLLMKAEVFVLSTSKQLPNECDFLHIGKFLSAEEYLKCIFSCLVFDPRNLESSLVDRNINVNRNVS